MDETFYEFIPSIINSRNRWDPANEISTQDNIENDLISFGVNYSREYRLSSSDRIDFFIDGIGIEVKLYTSLTKMTRQLYRYASHDEIKALVLVTVDPKLVRVPNTINGKPVEVIVLSAAMF